MERLLLMMIAVFGLPVAAIAIRRRTRSRLTNALKLASILNLRQIAARLGLIDLGARLDRRRLISVRWPDPQRPAMACASAAHCEVNRGDCQTLVGLVR